MRGRHRRPNRLLRLVQLLALLFLFLVLTLAGIGLGAYFFVRTVGER